MKRVLFLCTLFACITTACKKDKKNAAVATLTTTAVSGVASNSATTGGNVTDDGGSPISKRGVCFALHANPTISDSITSDGTGSGDFASTLTGLSAHATYYVRAYAINGSGTGYGNEISFTTAEGVPTVTTTPVTDIAPLNAKSGGEITNDGGAAIIMRGVCWSTSANPTIDDFKTEDGTGTGEFTSTLTPLASETTYYVRAYATNSHGTSYGNEVQFNAASANTVMDIDGNVYQYVTIGTQSWTTTNLTTTKFRNGDEIINGLTGFNWNLDNDGYPLEGSKAAFTYPNGDAANGAVYGKLYNIYAINDSRGVCPAGWHVPSDDEWKTLEINQGMTQHEADGPTDPDYLNSRGNIGSKLLAGGSSGLNLQLAGYMLLNNPLSTYEKFGKQGRYWSSTPSITDPGYEANYFRGFNINDDPNPIYRTFNGSSSPASVRCVKD